VHGRRRVAQRSVSTPSRGTCTTDNTLVSTLHRAGALERVLRLWPARWIVPADVRDEAAAWRAEGRRVRVILDALERDGVLTVSPIEPRVEGTLYARLQRTLGRGESAAIAMAFHRGLSVVVDDRRARQHCESLVPPVLWMSTEGVLGEAVVDGLLPRAEADAIWAATGIADPNRRVP
jgi:predicted nucleic acid-binding protein